MQYAAVIVLASLVCFSYATENPEFGVMDATLPIPVSCKQSGIAVMHQGQVLIIDVEYPAECWMKGNGSRDARDAIQSVFDTDYVKADRYV